MRTRGLKVVEVNQTLDENVDAGERIMRRRPKNLSEKGAVDVCTQGPWDRTSRTALLY
jgi:hypothetical protein